MSKSLTIFSLLSMVAMIEQGFGSEMAPQPNLTSEEHKKLNAQKTMILKEKMKQEGVPAEVAKIVGSQLYALPIKTFTCPTAQEVGAGLKSDGSFEKDGIQFMVSRRINLSDKSFNKYVSDIIAGPVQFHDIGIINKGGAITQVFCRYQCGTNENLRDFSLSLNLDQFTRNNTHVTVKPGILRNYPQSVKDEKLEFMVIHD